jgi:flagellar hook protein FlgE
MSGTIVITNATGAIASNSLALAVSGAIADPNSTAGGTITTNAIANAAFTLTGLAGSSTLTPLTQTTVASPSGTGSGTPGNPATRDVSSIVYDSLGVAHTVTMRFTKLAASSTSVGGTWHVALQSMNVVSSGVPSTTSALPANLGIIDFNQNGTIATTTPQLTAPGLTMSATGASDFLPTLNFGTTGAANGLTQFADVFAVSFTNQDGVPFGYRTGVSVDEDGLVRAVFDNGQQIPLFKVPLVTFANPNGLEPQTGNLYTQTIRSGDAVVNFAGIGGAGKLSPSTLESSTVDLAEEFTNMIITQRAYSASAKTITTADEMLNEVVNIKR